MIKKNKNKKYFFVLGIVIVIVILAFTIGGTTEKATYKDFEKSCVDLNGTYDNNICYDINENDCVTLYGYYEDNKCHLPTIEKDNDKSSIINFFYGAWDGIDRSYTRVVQWVKINSPSQFCEGDYVFQSKHKIKSDSNSGHISQIKDVGFNFNDEQMTVIANGRGFFSRVASSSVTTFNVNDNWSINYYNAKKQYSSQYEDIKFVKDFNNFYTIYGGNINCINSNIGSSCNPTKNFEGNSISIDMRNNDKEIVVLHNKPYSVTLYDTYSNNDIKSYEIKTKTGLEDNHVRNGVVKYSPDNKRILVGLDGAFNLHDGDLLLFNDKLELEKRITGNKETIRDIDFITNNIVVIVRLTNVIVMDLDKEETLLIINEPQVTSVTTNPIMQEFIITTRSEIKVYNYAGTELKNTQNIVGSFDGSTISNNGSLISAWKGTDFSIYEKICD